LLLAGRGAVGPARRKRSAWQRAPAKEECGGERTGRCARVEVSADGATAGEIRIHGGSGGALIREGSQFARHGGQLPGSPTPEPSPSPASRSTRARQPRPVRCGHPVTSPPSKTWAP